MTRKRRTSDQLYAAARTQRDIEAVTSGKPSRIMRRAKNKIVGRLLFRTIGRWLFR